MSNVLFDEQPIVINRTLASVIGLNESIVIQQVHYWIENIKRFKDKETYKDNFQGGEYWTYNSISKWHEENFDFWSFNTVKRTFEKLEKMNLLITGTYNKEKRDRTKWYRPNYDLLNEMMGKKEEKEEKNTPEPLHTTISSKWANGKAQNELMQKPILGQPLPKTSSKISSKIESQSVSQKKEEKKKQTDGRTKTVTEIVEQAKKIYGEDIVNQTLIEKMGKCKATGGSPYELYLTKCCEELKEAREVRKLSENVIEKKFTHEHPRADLNEAIKRKAEESISAYS